MPIILTHANLLEQRNHILSLLTSREISMGLQGLGNDTPVTPDRVEAGIGVLENHLYLLLQRTTLALGHRGSIDVIVVDAASGQGVEPCQQPCQGRFSTP